jgi:hypothetical protein
MGESLGGDSDVDLETGHGGQGRSWGGRYLEPLFMASTPKTEPLLWRSWEKGRRSSSGQRGDSSPGPR